jgi:hypothetical protein
VLRKVAEGVLLHESEFIQSNAVVVQGRASVLLIDPGIQGSEMACLANDLSDSGQTVVAGFSTHPHWARERGWTRVGLHVFGTNDVAQRLYQRTGYTVTDVVMEKVL